MRKNCIYPFSVKVVDYGDSDIEYEVVFNDLPDVIGVGDTIEEAIEDAQYNLDAYIKYCNENGFILPQPSKIKPLAEYSGKITVRLPKHLHRDLTEFAERDGMSINSLAIDAFRYYLNAESITNVESFAKEKIDTYIKLIGDKTKEMIEYQYNRKSFDEREYKASSNNLMGGYSYVN